jgi:ribosomal protein S12
MNFKLIDMNGVAVISLPTGYDLLEAFIGTNLQEKNEKGMWVIDSINEILSGKATNSTLSGVKYHVVELSNTTVKIIDSYSDDGTYCELPIDTFKSIIVNWLQQKDKYYGLN